MAPGASDSVDSLLESLVARDLRLANLFELGDGRWQANVTDGDKVWEFSRGGSAAIALRGAMFIAANEPGEAYGPEAAVSGAPEQTRKRVTLATAGDLGL
jgi:hypothetical protein